MGNSTSLRYAFGLLLLLATALSSAQARPGTPAPASAAYRESSVTLAQIVARQEENYKRIRTIQGNVVWIEERTTGTQRLTESRKIYFAAEGDHSVNLVIPHADSAAFAQREGKPDWSRVLAAYFVEGDKVYQIATAPGVAVPEVRIVLYNPAVHASNPLVAFQPRMLGDERVSLKDLSAVSAQMKGRPIVSEVGTGDSMRLRVDFVNPNVPGDRIYYVINPAKGYLAEEVGRISNSRLVAVTKIVVGNSKDGTWIPARRTKTQFNATGQPVGQESWYYEYLSINEPLPRRMVSLLYFQLPAGVTITDARGKPDPATRPQNSGSLPTPAALQKPPVRSPQRSR